jgi:ribosomal protein L17
MNYYKENYEKTKKEMTQMEEDFISKQLNSSILQHELIEEKNKEIEILRKSMEELSTKDQSDEIKTLKK